MKKTFFTHQIVYSTREIENIKSHQQIIEDGLIFLNNMEGILYNNVRIINVINELNISDGNFKKTSIILLCEGEKIS